MSYAGRYLLVTVLAVLLLTQLLPLPVSAAGVQNVCIQCHGAMTGPPGEPVTAWRGSVHEANGITCNGCHGGDPANAADAMKPSRGFLGVPEKADIPAFCGRCHVGVLKEYEASPHATRPGSLGPTCVTCHGSHRVLPATIDLISEKLCSRCHSFGRAAAIRAAMAGIEARVQALDARTAAYKRKGVDTDRIEKMLFNSKNRFHTLFHQLSVPTVQAESAAINAELDKVDAMLHGIDATFRNRQLAGIAAIATALLAALLLRLFTRTLKR